MRKKYVVGAVAAGVTALAISNPLVAEAARLITSSDIANGTIQNTGVAVWSWPGVWGGAYTPSESDGKRIPSADFGKTFGEIDLVRDPGQAKLGFLDGHVAIVKREQMFHRLFDPRFE